nr:retrovirus-related Pol polyprotein from transposon TNT 1-94 [Tanacetum cinerariifolium]
MSGLQLNSMFVNNMLPEWGRFVMAVKLNRGLRDSNYDQLYAYLKQHETHVKENKMMLERFSQPTLDPLALLSNVSNLGSSSTQVPPPLADSSSPAEDLIKNLTNTLALLTQSYRTFLPQTNNQLRTSSNARNQATVQDGRVDLALNMDNVFQADDCDAFDSNMDEAPTAQTMFMANLSSADPVTDEAGPSYDSDILSEVPDYEHYQDAACAHHEGHVTHDSVQLDHVGDSHADYTSDSNMIPYDRYVKDNEVPVVHSDASSVPTDAFMMIYNDMCESHDQSVFNPSQNTVVKHSLTAKLATYKEHVELYEQQAKFELTKREQKIDEQLRLVISDRNFKEETLKKELHSIKLQIASTINHHKSMVEEVMSLKKDFKQKENKYLEDFLDMKSLKEKPALYNGYEIIKDHEIIKDNHAPAIVHNSEDTLEIAEITMKKMNAKMNDPECVTRKRITPTRLTEGERGFEQTKECYLKEVIPFFKTLKDNFEGIQKALTKEIKEMKEVFEELEVEVAQYAVDRKHDAIEWKNLLIVNDNLISECLSQEVFSVATNSELNVARFTEMHVANTTIEARCLALEAELANLRDKNNHDNQKDLINHFSKLEVKPQVLTREKHAIDVEPIVPRLRNNRDAHLDYLRHLKESVETIRDIVEEAKATNVPVPPSTGVNSCPNASGSQPKSHVKPNRISPAKCVNKLPVEDQPRTNKSHLRTSNRVDSSSCLKRTVVQIVLWYFYSGCSKHMTRDRSRLMNFVKKFIGTVRFGNDHFGAIMGYGDYVIGNSVIYRVYYVEGLGHNLFSVGQFCDSDLEVAFQKHSCYVRDTDDVELIKGSRRSNLYTISIKDMMKSSPICLLSKASKNKSWLWHRRLNHLNFGTINDLARKDLVRGLPRLKFKKDHLCSACQLEKSKKHTYKPKAENTNLEVLNTLHMDLCGPMRVQTINGKKYILVIVDDYSRFTWVKFLRSKDETPDVVIKFIIQIQVGLNKTVRYIYTDNGTEFVNHTMTEYYERIGIFHQKTVPRTPQQNGVVERQNRTLLQPTADTGIFVGYAPSRKGYRIYTKSTQRIMETIHVQFDELTEPMAPVHLTEPNYMDGHTIAPVDNNPFVNIFTPEPHSETSSSGDISSTESP